MSRGPSIDPWSWTAERERAAELVADGAYTMEQIAEACGVDRRTILEWRHNPEFRDRVHEHLAAWRAKLASEGLAIKANRIALIMARAAMIRGVIRARGKLNVNAPGTTTAQKGCQVRTWKSLGGGDMTQIVEEFAVDVATLEKEQGYCQYIATELGEWQNAITVSGTLSNEPSPVAYALAETFTQQEIAAARERRRLKREAAEAAEAAK
jgi:hypothetical protein